MPTSAERGAGGGRVAGGHHVETLSVETRRRGLYALTEPVAACVARAGVTTGLCTVFVQHTSCSLVITENADPTARADLERFFERLAPDGDPRYAHDDEGPDDMAAHLRSVLTRTSEAVPIAGGRLTLGTWQGLYLYEHRLAPHTRRVVVHVSGT